MVVHACDSSSQEVETGGGTLRLFKGFKVILSYIVRSSQPGIPETPSQEHRTQKIKNVQACKMPVRKLGTCQICAGHKASGQEDSSWQQAHVVTGTKVLPW